MEICIWCLRSDGGDVGQEHILQDFLGAGLLLPRGVVCDRCNAFASALDGDLRRFLSATFFRTENTAILAGANAVVRVDGTWWATRINDRNWRRVLPTQCVVMSDGTVHGVAASEPLMQTMRSELQRPSAVQRRDSDEQLASPGCPIIVRAAEREFHLLATDADEPAARAGLPTVATRGWNYRADLQERLDRDGAPMRAVLSMNVMHANRALIKIALNFVAYTFGADVARLPLFAPIRGAVLRDERVDGSILDGDALRRFAKLDGHASDAEAVGAGIFDRDIGEAAVRLGSALLTPECHSVVLGAGKLGMFLFIALRGQPVARIRLLPKLPGFNVDGICAAWIVRPSDVPVLAPPQQLEELKNVLQLWAHALPAEQPTNDLSYSRSAPAPFAIEATYTPATT